VPKSSWNSATEGKKGKNKKERFPCLDPRIRKDRGAKLGRTSSPRKEGKEAASIPVLRQGKEREGWKKEEERLFSIP